MPVPHDFYSPWSDHPHLHNRHHSRPYVEPDWQAHAAGHQLPVLSTIGRGPRGYGMKIANYEADEKSFKFDIVCDDPNEEIQHIGPIPSGELILGQEAGAITLSSPYLKNDGSIGYKMQSIELPEAEPGSRVFTHLDSVPYQEDGFYDLDAFNLTYSNRRGTENLPEVRTWDSIIFKATDEDENDYLLVGDVLNANNQSDLVVGVHLEIPIANLTGEQGPKGDKGDKGNKGDAATISVGTVTTGNPGTQAAVINSGTNSSAVFDFTIPQGPKGDKGDKGDTGDTGPQGPTGPAGSNIPIYDLFANFTLSFDNDHTCIVNLGLGPESGLPENVVILGVPDFHIVFPADAEDYGTIMTVSYLQQYREAVTLHFYNPNKTENSSSISVDVHVLYTISAGTITTVGE